MAEYLLDYDADYKFMYHELGFATSADAREYMSTDRRFKSNQDQYIIVPMNRGDLYSIVHKDACAVHPSYDADECPLTHPTDPPKQEN